MLESSDEDASTACKVQIAWTDSIQDSPEILSIGIKRTWTFVKNAEKRKHLCHATAVFNAMCKHASEPSKSLLYCDLIAKCGLVTSNNSLRALVLQAASQKYT